LRRRDFITAIVAGAVWSRKSDAQQPKQVSPKPAVVGSLAQGSSSSPTLVAAREAYEQGLREEGYVEGQNIVIHRRYEEGPERLQRAAAELIALNVDVILAGGTPAALAAKRSTNTVPIVVEAMADPFADGLVTSLARPEGNITGNTFLGPELGPKNLQLLKEVVPQVSRVAVLQHPGVYSERTMQNMLTELDRAAKASAVDLQVFSAPGHEKFDDAFRAIINARMSALLVLPSPMFYVHFHQLVAQSAVHRLPIMYYFKEAVKAGGLISYGAHITDLVRRAGGYAGKILRGAKPADLPVEQPTKFELVANLTTAKALGVTFPPTLLARADEVIE
jgi:ABC-type uncharacterized transport system substrate-binding protein